jgi:hypothetical protein
MKNSIYAIKEWEYKNPFEIRYTMEIHDVPGQISIDFTQFDRIKRNADDNGYCVRKGMSSPTINPLNRACEKVLIYVIS